MPPLPDTSGPTTSYSDPIYDRLESVAQRLGRRLGFVILALVVGIIIAVTIHGRMQNSPEAASANTFSKAQIELELANRDRDPMGKSASITKAVTALQQVASDEAITPFFRCRAFIELVQQDLSLNNLSEAKGHAAKAVEFAAKSADTDLQLKAELSNAAVLLQSSDNAEAEKAYLLVEKHAGAKSVDSQMVAVLGAARAMELQGRLDDAATKLESITSRNDASAQQLVQLARQAYWRLKHMQNDKPAQPPPGAQATPPAQPGTAAAAQPKSAAPASAAPATPAHPASAPVIVASPAPTAVIPAAPAAQPAAPAAAHTTAAPAATAPAAQPAAPAPNK
jgi:hypothetical protein